MTPSIPGHISIIDLVLCLSLFWELFWSREKFVILSIKPRSHVRILMYQTWAILLNTNDVIVQDLISYSLDLK